MRTETSAPPAPPELEAAGLARLYDGARRLQEVLAQVAKSRGTGEAVIETLRAPLIIVDREGRIRAANQPFLAAFSARPAQPVGRPLGSLPGSLWCSPKLRGLIEAATTHAEVIRDVSLEGTVGPVPRRTVLLANARRIETADGLRVVLALEDATALERTARFDELRRRVERDREMLARVAHQLRTPVAAIKGYAETLRRGGLEDRRRRKEFVRTIERQSDWLGRIVEELLTLYSLEAGAPAYKPQNVDLAAFLKTFAAGLAPVARRRKVRLRVQAEPGARAWADRDQLERALQSLCENALAHAASAVELDAFTQGRHAVIGVIDDGPGVPEPLLPYLFDGVRDASAPSRGRRGTGLGLRIARSAVAVNHGRIWAENVRGGGSIFRFTLPLKPRSE